MPLRPPAGFIRPGYDPLKVPNAPTIGTATGGDASASVAFTAPSNVGGSAISAYYAVSNPDQITGTGASSPVSVTGLTNGTAYTFAVWALNTYGPSPFSAASNSVTPAAVIGLFAERFAALGLNVINQISISTTGNATDFGDFPVDCTSSAGCASSTRGVFGGSAVFPSGVSNTIQYVTFASAGDALDFGDLTVARKSLGAFNSSTRGVFAAGEGVSAGSGLNVMDYITIASTGNATDFGDTLSGALNAYLVAGFSSPTRGVLGGGRTSGAPSGINVIQYVTIATTGNATDFGDLLAVQHSMAGASNSTRGIFAGGVSSNVIQYITIATTGNATDFGDLTTTAQYPAGCSSSTRAVFGGGSRSSANIMDYVTIASTGNALDFGDLTADLSTPAACSNGNGGLS